MNRMSCSITTTASPRSRILKISSSACRVSCGFIPAVGSSSRISLGSVASARAISSRRWSPYGRLRARWSVVWPSPTKSSSSCDRSRTAFSSRRNFGPRMIEVERAGAWSGSSGRPSRSPARSCCRTAGCSGTSGPCRPARPCAASAAAPAPSSTTRPLVGRYRPVRQLKNVVLPAPLGPISPMISPRWTVKFTESTAVRPPNRMVTFSAARIGRARVPLVDAARSWRSQSPPSSCRSRTTSSSIRSASSSSSSWNSSCRRWLGTRPSGRNRIIRTSSRPKISSRYSLTKRSFSGMQLQQGRSDQHAEHGAHAAQHDRGQQERRLQEHVLVRGDRDVHVGLDRASHAGQEGAAGEGEELEAEDVDAHRLGGLLVLADGHPAATDPAVVEPDEDQDDQPEHQQQQEVVVREPAQRDAEQHVRFAEVEAEQNEVGDGGDAVGAVGQVRPASRPGCSW